VSFVATASECASVTTPDIAHRPDVPRQSRQAIIPLGGFVRSRAVVAVYQNDLFKRATRAEASEAKTIRYAGRPRQAIS
jgi:hypothetical protein